MKALPTFPPEFRFGVATADHQCEAYAGQDDIRDVWERVRGLTPRGRATDFWNRYREDVDLARGLGCRAFRLSLSWARLEPSPRQWDDGAFAHYRDVLQYMRDAGMATVVTLHHNTWPIHVQEAGNGSGMLDPGFPDRLAAYASEVARRLGDLIDYYVTLNEPNQLVYGYIKGWWMRAYPVPPGLEAFASGSQQMESVLLLIPNLFRAHARARAAIKKARPGAMVGTNPLVLGLPRWLQHWIDRAATNLKEPDDLRAQAKRLSKAGVLDRGRVDISIAQIEMSQSRMERVLFSEPYYIARGDGREEPYAVAMPLGSRTLLNVVDRALRDFKRQHPEMPTTHNRKTIAHIGKREERPDEDRDVPDLDESLRAIRRRGVLRAGIHPGAKGLCVSDGAGGYAGLEPDLARHIAKRILGSEDCVRFVELEGEQRVRATRSRLANLDGLRKSLSIFATILGTNWWNLGMAGRLAPFLCPPEAVGALDFVGLDYYWGIPSLRPAQVEHLLSAMEFRYANAPVWPRILRDILREQSGDFPGKPILVIENGCVTSAEGIARPDYIARHLLEVQRAVADGVPVAAYLCWSITSNREWGLPFDNNSDFGIYHIELDRDPALTRTPTPASTRYAQIIAARSAVVP
jgi:beta-glucosidase/6-phospho-beta-glucosidase/beta-galactosidase